MSTNAVSQDPRYPIGEFVKPQVVDGDSLRNAILDLAELPEQLRNALDGLSDDELATPYREGGWTVRQVTHHLADSHLNAFIRVRKALTEETPLISVYDEKRWVELPDRAAPVEWSLELLEGLHARWVMMLHALTPEQWKRGFVHPERGLQTVEVATLLYGWHAKHHVAHITHLRAVKGW